MDTTTRGLDGIRSAARLGLVAVAAAAASLLLFPAEASTVSSGEEHFERGDGCVPGCDIGAQVCCFDPPGG